MWTILFVIYNIHLFLFAFVIGKDWGWQDSREEKIRLILTAIAMPEMIVIITVAKAGEWFRNNTAVGSWISNSINYFKLIKTIPTTDIELTEQCYQRWFVSENQPKWVNWWMGPKIKKAMEQRIKDK